MPAGVPGMAAADAFQGKPNAAKYAVAFDGLQRVGGTARIIATAGT